MIRKSILTRNNNSNIIHNNNANKYNNKSKSTSKRLKNKIINEYSMNKENVDININNNNDINKENSININKYNQQQRR